MSLEAVIFIGIPGTGKSTLFHERFADTHVRINLDMLKTRNREKILVEACQLFDVRIDPLTDDFVVEDWSNEV